MPKKYISLEARLYANVEEVPHENFSEPCLIWQGALNNNGYGKIAVRSRYRNRNTGHRKLKVVYAHRLSLAVATGLKIWQLNKVCHLCDNRACIEPTHLVSKSQKWNMRDMVKKRRHKNGYSDRSVAV